jgi:hypothetical protein
MIVGFTGTREGGTVEQMLATRAFLRGIFLRNWADVFVHGGSGNSDHFAHMEVRAAQQLAGAGEIWVFPAIEGRLISTAENVPFHGIIAEPIPALERNHIIAGLADGLLAVPATDEEGRSGTWATVRYALKLGCPVYIVKRNGAICRYPA